MEKIIDLHIHTNVSDGVLSPKEVVDMAVKNGAGVIAIADHDTVDAYNDELFDYAEARNMISCQKHNILNMRNKEYIRLRALLKRNPHAVSKMHEQAFSEIMEITEEEVQEEPRR